MAREPSWYGRKTQIEKQLLDSKINNIHFLHLDFNTLPENKKWIMGCQCKFCIEYEEDNMEICDKEYSIQNDHEGYYDTKDVSSIYTSKWTSPYYTITNKIDEIPLVGYNPLYGSDYEDLNTWIYRNGNLFTFRYHE